jgi:hypothetical protein
VLEGDVLRVPQPAGDGVLREALVQVNLSRRSQILERLNPHLHSRVPADPAQLGPQVAVPIAGPRDAENRSLLGQLERRFQVGPHLGKDRHPALPLAGMVRRFIAVGDSRELFQGGLEIVRNFVSENVGSGEVIGILQALVLEPEDIEVGLVAFDEVLVIVRAKAALGILLGVPGGLAKVAFSWPVAADKLVQVAALQRVGLLREVHVGPQVIHPQRLGPRFFLGRAWHQRTGRWL